MTLLPKLPAAIVSLTLMAPPLSAQELEALSIVEKQPPWKYQFECKTTPAQEPLTLRDRQSNTAIPSRVVRLSTGDGLDDRIWTLREFVVEATSCGARRASTLRKGLPAAQSNGAAEYR